MGKRLKRAMEQLGRLNPNFRHGYSGSRIYASWASMMQRCYNQNNPKYPEYGGRGIKVQKSWHNAAVYIEEMHADLGEMPPGMTPDRIDNNGDYRRGNMRWATPEMQANNQRTNHLITISGETKTIRQWEKEAGLKVGIIKQRLYRGWSVEMLLLSSDDARIERLMPSKRNTSGYKGVNWNNTKNKWEARIAINHKRIYLGSFDDPYHAHVAYKIASEKLPNVEK